MKKSSSIGLKIVIILSIAAICLSSVSLYTAKKAASQPEPEIQYVMYLGTNDKDTNKPVCTPDEAKERTDAILIDHFGGFTIQEANGGWVDDNGTRYDEYTLVIYLSDTNEKEVHKAADDLIKEFNQSSVLIQANQTNTEFYSTENN